MARRRRLRPIRAMLLLLLKVLLLLLLKVLLIFILIWVTVKEITAEDHEGTASF